jgi:hypothetical protein
MRRNGAPRAWTGVSENLSAVTAVSATIRVICAASAHAACGRTSHNPPVVGSRPTRPLASTEVYRILRCIAEQDGAVQVRG